MNNQQAINLLKGLEQSLDDYYGLNDEGKTAFGMAITALELFGNSEQLPPVPIEQIARDIATIIENEKDMRVVLKNAARIETHEWIPCSERMPEEHEWMGTKRFGTTISDEVYVTFENPKGERFCKHLSFQNGKLSGFDQSTIDAFYKGSKPIAWMPLPKPYAERKEDASSR